MKSFLTYLLLTFWLAGFASAQIISPDDTSSEYTLKGTFYHDRFVGRKTSSGEVFNQHLFTAAHRHIKFGTLLLVTNPKNGKQVIVKINDRCPKDKILDMTRMAVNTIGIKTSTVIVKVLPPRYKIIWEQQDNLKDILSEGRIMEYASCYFSAHKTSSAANDPSPDYTRPTLYDIEILQGDLSSKDKAIEHLPIYLQDKVGIRNSKSGKNQKIVIFLSLPHEEAAKILLSIKAYFPNATLIQSN